MPILSFIAASLIVVPQTDDRFARKVFDNYPVQAQMRNQSGAVRARYWLKPDGEIYRCEALQVFGGEIFGPAACKSIIGFRLRQTAAVGSSSAYGMITTMVFYTVRGGGNDREILSIQRPADLTLAGTGPATDAAEIRIAVQVEPYGSVTRCEGMDGAAEALVERACAEAKRRGAPPGTDAAGAPISYVTALVARFAAANPS